jgi:hypothetical protein
MSQPVPLDEYAARMNRYRTRARWAIAGFASLTLLAAGPASTALAAGKPTAPAGYTATKLANAPAGASNCDDLAFLAGYLFVGCQNKTLSNGGGGNSTLVEYSTAGAVVKTWSVKDKIDGLQADPLKHFLIATLNEDATTHLVTITPTAPAAQQLTYYTYSPDPRGASTPTALRTGGGTDHVIVDSAGHIFTNASHAGTTTGTAVFKVVLTPPKSPTGTGKATLSPTFLDNASAANGNTGKGTVKLALGDVDSAAIVPKDSPRFGGSYVITDQTALELVFAKNIFAGTGLTVLKTPFGLDDLLWTSSPHGTLYVVDKGPTALLPKVSASSLWKVTGPFAKSTVLASNDGVGSELVTVNLTNGKLTSLVNGFQTTKGLVYLNANGTQTQLPLNGGSAIPVAAPRTPTSTSGPTPTGGSLSPALIILIILGGLAILSGSYRYIGRRGLPGRTGWGSAEAAS